jgi:inner membrane protein
LRIDKIFEKSLAEQGIQYNRFRAAPTIFNNILWQGTAEGDTAFYYGEYSFFDAEPKILEFMEYPKNHDLLSKYEGNRDVEILKWFSDNYYWIEEKPNGVLQFNDLRTISNSGRGTERTSVFSFTIEEIEGKIIVKASDDDNKPTKEALDLFFKRMRGIASN